MDGWSLNTFTDALLKHESDDLAEVMGKIDDIVSRYGDGSEVTTFARGEVENVEALQGMADGAISVMVLTARSKWSVDARFDGIWPRQF